MYLAYFDENKYSKENPFFFIGGYLVSEDKALELESTLTQIQSNFFGSAALRKDTEFHGKEMFHGKGHFKKRKLNERVQLFEDIATFIIDNQLPIRMVCIDVDSHRKKYTYPQPEYRLGLMLILERFCDYLQKSDDIGAVFGDYEKDEISRAILDFAEFETFARTHCRVSQFSKRAFFEKNTQKALNQPYLLADYSIFPPLFHFLGATCLLKR